MNRLVCRVMMGVAGLALLGMTATLAGAQTDEVKEKPRLYRFESYWTFPRAHWGEVDKDNDIRNQKILAPALADGTLIGYGDEENLVHSVEGFTHGNWWQANSWAGVLKVLEAFHKGGGSNSPLLVSSTKHGDHVFFSRFYNRKAGSWKGAYGYTATYRLKPDAPDDAVRMLSQNWFVPLLEKLLADGPIVEYEIDQDTVHTDSPDQFFVYFLMPSVDGLDKVTAAIRAAVGKNPLIGPAFASMVVNVNPRPEWERVNATYK
jgi:hypothetical protein